MALLMCLSLNKCEPWSYKWNFFEVSGQTNNLTEQLYLRAKLNNFRNLLFHPFTDDADDATLIIIII